MRKRLFNIAAVIAVVAVALTFAADGQAGLLDKLKRTKVAKKSGTETAVGIYSGRLSGEIKIQKQKVLITPKTLIYVIGQGPRDGSSMVVTKRPVSATGQRTGKVLVADMVLVRPNSSTIALNRPDGGRVTPGANPNVGMLNEPVEP